MGARTAPINADHLLKMVTNQIIDTVMTDATIKRLTGIIQGTATETSSRLQTNLDQTELALEKLNRRENDLLTKQQMAGGNFDDELANIAAKRTALAYEARNSHREIDAQAFISDENRIGANARDIDTYLDEDIPEQASEFIGNFANRITVDPSSVQLTYKFAIPSARNPQGKLTDLIPRLDTAG